MPYIKKINRPSLDDHTRTPFNAGDLNYCITRLCDDYLLNMGKTYANINEVVGVLECAKLEFARRILFPYEEEKLKDPTGGEVYKSA